MQKNLVKLDGDDKPRVIIVEKEVATKNPASKKVFRKCNKRGHIAKCFMETDVPDMAQRTIMTLKIGEENVHFSICYYAQGRVRYATRHWC